jgi:hypothetical protein
VAKLSGAETRCECRQGGRPRQFNPACADGRLRRVSPVASRHGEGPFMRSTAGGPAWLPELVCMPPSCHFPAFSKMALQGVDFGPFAARHDVRPRTGRNRMMEVIAGA